MGQERMMTFVKSNVTHIATYVLLHNQYILAGLHESKSVGRTAKDGRKGIDQHKDRKQSSSS